LEVSIEINFK